MDKDDPSDIQMLDNLAGEILPVRIGQSRPGPREAAKFIRARRHYEVFSTLKPTLPKLKFLDDDSK